MFSTQRNITPTLVVLVVMFLFLLAITSGCATAKFELSNLTITPGQIVARESAMVSIDIANVGGAEGTYLITLKIDDAESDHQEVAISPGETEKVTFTVSEQEPGTYAIDVDGMITSLRVLRPAELMVENLTVSPEQVVVGQESTVSVDVKNTGEVRGTCQLVLKTDGEEAETQEISVDPTATQNVTFTLTTRGPGTCSIDVNGLTSTLRVLKPAEFKMGSLIISPQEVAAGSRTTISTTVTNTGEVSGEYNLTLVVDGQEIDEKNVTVTAGTTQPVSFELTKAEVGTYQISVNDLTGTFKVISARPGWTDWGLVDWGDGYEATPGTRVDLVLKQSWITDGEPYVLYNLKTEGLPDDKIYYLWFRSLTSTTPTRGAAPRYIDNDGYVVTADGSPIGLGFYSYAKGEVFEVAVATDNRSILAYGKVIPYPIETRQGHYRLWVELKDDEGTFFIIRGEGFESNEEPNFTSNSEGEILEGKYHADSEGLLTIWSFPAVIGKESGIVTEIVSGKAGQITISYEWGPEATASASALLPRVESVHCPIIDGRLIAGEWDAAFKADFTVGTVSGPVSGRIYAVHNGVNLYMAIDFTYGQITWMGPGDYLWVNFDNDGAGGARVIGDDVIMISNRFIGDDVIQPQTSFTDSYVETVGSSPEIGIVTRLDTMHGGQNDGAGACSTDGTYTTYEFWHPLNSSDNSYDFSLQPGNEFGFTITLRVGPIYTSFPSGWMIQTDDYMRVLIVP